MTRPTLRIAAFCVFCTLCAGSVSTRADDALPTTWTDLRSAAAEMTESQKYDEALALIDKCGPGLVDRRFEISDLKLEILFTAERHDEAMDVWEKGVDAGDFYFVIPRTPTYDPVRKSERFRSLLERNNRLRDAANDASKPEFEIVAPASYSPEGSYPLVMVIHGGNQSIVKAMERWDPKAIGDDVIIAYVQSSMRADSKSYRWDLSGVDIYSRGKAQDEVLGLYLEIIEAYPVDTAQVALAGFSQGGNLALFMASEGTIPAKGMIVGCPATRSPVPAETARAAAERGLSGTIFVGATDWTASATQSTVDNFTEAGAVLNHIVMEEKGHEFPDDFDAVLRGAVERIYR